MLPFSDNQNPEQRAFDLIRIAGLVARERLGELDEQEREELGKWLQENSIHKSWKDKLSGEAYVNELLQLYDAARNGTEESLALFHQQHIQPSVPAIGRRSRMRYWWAAAAILVPCLLGSIWLWQSKQLQFAEAGGARPLILPAGKVATLTLANGQRVVLDSGRTGRVVQGGSVQVDYKDGQVVYKPGKTAGTEIAYNTLSTGKGGLYELLLPDGTRVWLNAVSSLRYPTSFTGKERHVELTGQGYFEVAGRRDQPFTVGVSGMNVTVVGTEFDVMAYADELARKTTVISGAVKVQQQGSVQQVNHDEQVIVAANGQVTLNKQVNVENVIAWKLGYFQFNHMDIQTLMREIARWYDVEIVFQRTDLTGAYGGRISRTLDLAKLIGLLEGSGIGHFRIEGRRLIVLP